MHIAFRILSILAALFFSFTAFSWIFDPASAAESLGMELLRGSAASTQIGDIGALFFSGAVFMWWGQLPGKSQWLYAAALILGLTAFMRTTAWALGNADFMVAPVIGEVIFVVILVVAARLRTEEI